MAASVGSETEMRRRSTPQVDSDHDAGPPYGGKVFLARRKKDDPLYIRIIEGLVLCGTILFAFYAYFYFDNLHFHVTHAYAHLGYSEAQHQVGQRYLYGVGIQKHEEKAMQWFKKASDQGHPNAGYNLAIGHLKGMKTELKEGEVHSLIAKAAKKGVILARETLDNVCSKGGCDG